MTAEPAAPPEESEKNGVRPAVPVELVERAQDQLADIGSNYLVREQRSKPILVPQIQGGPEHRHAMG